MTSSKDNSSKVEVGNIIFIVCKNMLTVGQIQGSTLSKEMYITKIRNEQNKKIYNIIFELLSDSHYLPN